MNPYQVNQSNNPFFIGQYNPSANQAPLVVITGQSCPILPVVSMTTQSNPCTPPTSQPILQIQNPGIAQCQSQPQFISQPQFSSQSQFISQSQFPSQSQFSSQSRIPSQSQLNSHSQVQHESDVSSEFTDDDDDYESDEDSNICPECMISQVLFVLLSGYFYEANCYILTLNEKFI